MPLGELLEWTECDFPEPEHDLFLILKSNVRVPKLFIHKNYLLSSKHRDMHAEPNLVLTISPFLLMTKLCILMNQFCINISQIVNIEVLNQDNQSFKCKENSILLDFTPPEFKNLLIQSLTQ